MPLKAEYINAFIEASQETFEQMCNVKGFRRVGQMRKVNGQIVDTDDLMAIVGLSAGRIKGAVMLTTPLITGMKLVGSFMMDEIDTINSDLMDGFGEIVNIIAGAADAKIQDFNLQLSLPTILLGNNTKFFAKASTPFIVVPMFIEGMGNFNLGVSLDVP